MKEADAKNRWCPFARSTGWGDGLAANRDLHGGFTEGETCLGPSCMAWRWQSKDEGFCGMAGRPAT